MTNEELEGRLVAVEGIAVMALGIYMANAGNDPDMSKARAFLDYMRSFIHEKSNGMPAEVAEAAKSHADDLLSQVLENLHTLRGGR